MHDTRIKLPIDVAELDSTAHTIDTQAIENINAQYQSLKKRLKTLEKDKGLLSKKVGQAKKANNPTADLMSELATISATIKDTKRQLTQLSEEANAFFKSDECPQHSTPVLPQHFQINESSESRVDFQVIESNEAHAYKWNQFVNTNLNSSVYHLYEFKNIVEKSFGHTTIYFIAIDTKQEVVGILPAVQLNSRLFGNYIVSIPFFNYGGAIANHSDIESALNQALENKALELGATHIEYRDIKPREGLPSKTEKLALVLKLPTHSEELWADIGSKVRSQIKKSETYNLTYKTGKADLLNEFYDVFSRNMRDLGTPVYHKCFFKNILDCSEINATIAIVTHHNKPVSCAFLIHYRDTMEIPWASTIQQANQYNANMFMYWNVLKTAITNKAEYFDFGRSSDDGGTFKFKLQWGAHPLQLYWNYWLKGQAELPELNPNNPKYQLAITVWKKLPVWLTTLIGPHIVKNLP